MSSIKDFKDKFGLVYSSTNLDSGNVIRTTSEWIICSGDEDTALTLKVMLFNNGVWTKGLNRPDQITWDDMIPMFRAYKCTEVATQTYNQLHKAWWFYPAPNTSSKFQSFLGRNPSFVIHARNCAGIKVSNFEKLLLGVLCLASIYMNPKGQDEYALGWHCLKAFEGKSRFINACLVVFEYKLAKEWGSMNECMKAYFGFNHPIAEYWK